MLDFVPHQEDDAKKKSVKTGKSLSAARRKNRERKRKRPSVQVPLCEVGEISAKHGGMY